MINIRVWMIFTIIIFLSQTAYAQNQHKQLIEGLKNSVFYDDKIKSITLNLNFSNKIQPYEMIVSKDHPNGIKLLVLFKNKRRQKVINYAVNLNILLPKMEGIDEFGELKSGYYLQAGTHYFGNEKNPKILIGIGDGLNLTLIVFEYRPTEVERVAQQVDSWKIIGKFEGQSKAIIEDNKIIIPYGSQGLFHEYEYVKGRFSTNSS